MKGLMTFFIGYLLSATISSGQQISVKATSDRLVTRGYQIYLSAPDSAIALSNSLLKNSLENNAVYYQGQAYYILSKAYWVKANYRLSTEFGFKALKVFESTKHHHEWVNSLLSVARTLADLGNIDAADQLISKAIGLSKRTLNDTLLAESIREKSYVLTRGDNIDSALIYADIGIKLFRRLGDSLDVSILYGRKAGIFYDRKEYQKSLSLAYRGIELDKKVGNQRALGVAYCNAAQNEIALRNYDKAKLLLNQSMQINAKIGNLKFLSRTNELMAELHLIQNQPLEAAKHFQKANQLKDSLFNVEKNGQIQEMQALYDLGEKENTIKFLEHKDALHHEEARAQRLFVAVLIIGILLLAFILFFVARLRMVQIKANKALTAKNLAIELQKEELLTQAESLQRLNRLQSKLFSVISHDLRGPIGNLQGVLELFTKKQLSEKEMVELSSRLRNNLKVTQRTLENLLNWALSQMDGIKTDKKQVRIEGIINDACDVMLEAADRKKIAFSKDIEHDMHVLADADQIQLVIRNLIHNGIKFSKIGDTINIVVTKENSICRVRVIDTGIGTSSEEVEIILGSTEHFTKMGTQQEKGTGLGLLLCKEFIERNGGTFEFASRLGKGTEVSFTLSLA
jgi:two-component system sensor histidine kinase/response regulator